MPIDQNVRVVRSQGTECLVCEQDIDFEETSIEVSFNVDLVITKKKVTKEMHVCCGEDLKHLLDLRLTEAKKRR